MGGRGSEGMVPAMPPSLQHWHILSPTRHRTDTLRRLIHALDAQRVLVFMNWLSHLPVRCPPNLSSFETISALFWPPCTASWHRAAAAAMAAANAYEV